MAIIKGKVVSNAGEPLQANVFEENTTVSAQCDENGNFTMFTTGLSNNLRFTHVGYDYDTVSISDFQKNPKMILFPSNNVLEAAVFTSPKPKPETKTTNWWWLLLLPVAYIGKKTFFPTPKSKNVKM